MVLYCVSDRLSVLYEERLLTDGNKAPMGHFARSAVYSNEVHTLIFTLVLNVFKGHLKQLYWMCLQKLDDNAGLSGVILRECCLIESIVASTCDFRTPSAP